MSANKKAKGQREFVSDEQVQTIKLEFRVEGIEIVWLCMAVHLIHGIRNQADRKALPRFGALTPLVVTLPRGHQPNDMGLHSISVFGRPWSRK